MLLWSLRLENVKLLVDQTFSFVESDGSLRRWTVLLGDNGVCKTTVLQAIALAGSGEKIARGLIDDGADYVRQDRLDRGASVDAEFEVDRKRLHIEMKVGAGSHAFQGGADTSLIDSVRDSRQPGFFLVGYGAGRRLPKRGEVAVPRDPVRNRVEGLFDTHHKMLGTDFFDALQERELAHAFARTLRDVLVRSDATGVPLLPWIKTIELRGQGGIDLMEKLLASRRMLLDVGGPEPLKIAPHLLSQGYQSTFAWITDLLGQAFLDSGQEVTPDTLQGVVRPCCEFGITPQFARSYLHPRIARRGIELASMQLLRQRGGRSRVGAGRRHRVLLSPALPPKRSVAGVQSQVQFGSSSVNRAQNPLPHRTANPAIAGLLRAMQHSVMLGENVVDVARYVPC